MRTIEIIRSAWRSLWVHRFQTGLTVALLAVGMAVIVGVLAFCEGTYRHHVRELGKRGQNYCELYTPYRKGRILRWLRPADLAAARQHSPSLLALTPILDIGRAPLRLGGKRVQAGLVGVEPQYFGLRRLGVGQGRYFTTTEVAGRQPVIVLGAVLADGLLQRGGLVGRRVLIGPISGRRVLVRVLGVAERTGDERFDGNAYLPLPLLQEMVGIRAVDCLLATASTLERTPGLQHELTAALAGRSVYVEGENQLELVLQRSLGMRHFARIVFYCGLGLGLINALVVAKVLVSASLERRQEVGLRKALGARNREILWQHLLEPAFAVGAGLLAGMALGAATLPVMRLLMSWPPAVPWGQVYLLAAITWLLAQVASATPAWQASQLDPARMLRAA